MHLLQKAGIIFASLTRRFYPTTESMPYEASAQFYDALMEHVDYEEWAEYVHLLLQKFEITENYIVDFGCGTGTFLHQLESLGYRGIGYDISYPMVREAENKYGPKFWQGDLLTFGIRPFQGAATCIYDSIQYLSFDELSRFFKNLNQMIVADTLFIFDVVTETHVTTYWKNVTEVQETDSWRFWKKSWYDSTERIQHTEIISCQKHTTSYFKEHHKQHIFKIDELRKAILNSGLVILGIYADFTLNPGSEKNDRLHFVLKKESL